MGELRTYALPVAELRHVAGSTGPERERYLAVAQRAFAPPPPSLAERLGPIHRRVPGTRPTPDDEPSPADLTAFLDGRSLSPDRARAGWRLVEAFAANLARSATTVDGINLPAGLLAPLGLPVPPTSGVVAGWCHPDALLVVPALRAWARSVEPALDVVVLG